MWATIVNCIAIIIGSLIGIVFSKKITEELSGIISAAAGIVTLVIGFKMSFETTNIIYMVLSLIIGGILGTWWDIDGKILAFGRFLAHRFHSQKNAISTPQLDSEQRNSSFAYAFLNSSVLFCVGAMAILGSFKAGTEGDYTILYTKSVLDGFMAIVFSAAMGIGTAFSAISIFLYQGLLTVTSTFIKPYVTDLMIKELTGVGGALIVMIGVTLLELRKLKTANYLPSLLIIIVFVLLGPYVSAFASVFI